MNLQHFSLQHYLSSQCHNFMPWHWSSTLEGFAIDHVSAFKCHIIVSDLKNDDRNSFFLKKTATMIYHQLCLLNGKFIEMGRHSTESNHWYCSSRSLNDFTLLCVQLWKSILTLALFCIIVSIKLMYFWNHFVMKSFCKENFVNCNQTHVKVCSKCLN